MDGCKTAAAAALEEGAADIADIVVVAAGGAHWSWAPGLAGSRDSWSFTSRIVGHKSTQGRKCTI